MSEVEVPFVPTYIKEPRVFYDRKRGLMMLGRKDGELWLFLHNVVSGFWSPLRLATDNDVKIVSEAMRR
jgi:hypothetical protein